MRLRRVPKSYRRLILIKWAGDVIYWLTRPYYFVKGKILKWKILRQTPNRWERYVIARELSNKLEREDALAESWGELIGDLTMFRLCLLTKVGHTSGAQRLSEDGLKQIDDGIEDFRKDILADIARLVENGATGTEGLAANVAELDPEKLEDVDEVVDYADASDEELRKIRLPGYAED